MADNDNNLVFTVSSDMSAAQRGVDKFVGDIGASTDKISKKFEALGRSIDKGVSTSLQQRINSMVGVGTTAAKEWNGALADQGKQLDALRAKYSPLFATVKQYQAAQSDIRTLYRSGKLSVDEYTAALSKQRQAALANIAAIKGVPKAQNDNGGGNSYIYRNIAQQVNQIGQQGAATGNYLQALAIQLPDILGALGSLPAVLAGGALAVGGSFLSMALETKKLDDVLGDHEKLINRIVDAYGGLAESAAKAGTDSKQLLDALGAKNQSALSVATAAAAKDYFGNSKVGTTPIGGRFRGFQATTTEFQEPLAKLRADVRAGKADFDAFYETIARKVEANPGLAKAGNDVIALSEDLKRAADAAKQYQRIQDALFNDIGPNKQLLSQGTTNTADAGNFALYQSQQRIALQRSQQSFDAQIAGINARSTAERVAAARASATAQYNDDESPSQRRQRIDQAGLEEQARAEKQLSDAQRERSLSLQKLLDDQQFEISLVGKTSQEADVLRKAYELTSQIRLQAAKDGNTVDEKEIDIIQQKVAELGKLQQAYKALSTGVTSRGFVIGSPAEQEFFDYTDNQRLSLDRGNEGLASQIASLRARTSAQRVAAARQAAAAQHHDESAAERDQRINNAGLLVQEQINKELADAERERSLNLKRLLDDQKQDIALIGKTGGAAAAATQQYQQLAQLRAEAAKQGITDEAEFQRVFAGQIDLIKRTAESYGQLVDTYGRLKLTQDLSDQNMLAALPERERQIVTMQRQYGLPEDPNSDTGKQIGQSIDRQANREAITGFLTDFKNGLVKNGDSIGKAFGDALKNALMKEADKIWDRLFNQLANAILGTGTGGANAGAAGGVLGVGASAVGKALSPGIINTAPVGAVTRAALPNIGATTDVASYIAKAAVARGIDPNTALAVAKSEGGLSSWNMQSGVFKNGIQEPSFGPFQLYKGGGLGNAFQKQTGLDPALAQNGPAGVDFALDYAAKNGWGSWYGAKNTGISNWQGIGTNTNSAMNSASDAVNKLAENSKAAAANVGTFGSGLGQLGQQLGGSASGGFFPQAPSAGFGGWLSGLFGGGLTSYGSSVAAASPQFASALASGGIGLFADGGYTGPGGKNTPAGIVHAGEFVVPKHIVDKIGVPALSTMMKGYADGGLVTPALVSAPRAPALRASMAPSGSNGGQPGTLNVHIHGASGDDHVRTLVKQGVGEGLNSYNDNQVRGGFGNNQNKWNARKG